MKYFFNLTIFYIVLSLNLFASSNQLDNVSLQLQWKHQFKFSGLYKDVGLDVDIREFEHHIDIVRKVVEIKFV